MPCALAVSDAAVPNVQSSQTSDAAVPCALAMSDAAVQGALADSDAIVPCAVAVSDAAVPNAQSSQMSGAAVQCALAMSDAAVPCALESDATRPHAPSQLAMPPGRMGNRRRLAMTPCHTPPQ